MSEIIYKKFKIPVKNSLIMLAGKRRAGKTFFLKNFIREHHNDYNSIRIFKNTKSENAYKFKDDKIQKKIKTKKFSLKKLKDLIIVQEYYKEIRSKISTLLIIDDCLGSLKDKAVKNYITGKIGFNGRHINDNLTIIITAQKLKKFLEAGMRDNMDIIIFAKLSPLNRSKVRKDYFDGKDLGILFNKHYEAIQKKKYLKLVIDDISSEIYITR